MRFPFLGRRSRQPREDFYITLLRYGREHLDDGVTFEQAQKYMLAQGFDSPLIRDDEAFRRRFTSAFSAAARYTAEAVHFLNMADYFLLLEYEELQEARSSAQSAKRIAIAAITIAALMAMASVGLQAWSIWG